MAFMFMAQRLTGSVAMVGYVGAMEMLPYLLVGPYAGVLADRLDRRRVMLLSDLFSAGALVLFAVLVILNGGRPPVWALLVVPFVLSTMRCFFMPAKSAAIPSLVPKELLTKANALSSATFNVMSLVGLAFSATVVSQLYVYAPRVFFVALLGLNSLSFLGSAVFIRRMPPVVPDREHAEEKHPFDDFKSGLRYIKGRHDLVVLTLVLASFRLGVAPFFVVYVAANKQWFGDKPQTLIWFEFAFFAGMILGSVMASRMKVRRPTVAFNLALAGVGLGIAGMGFTPYFAGFVILNFLCGVVIPMGDVPIMTYLQTSVEDAYRGRVNSVRDMISVGVMPIGMVMAGGLVKSAGLVMAFLLMGAGMMISALSAMLDRRYRHVVVEVPKEQVSDSPALVECAA